MVHHTASKPATDGARDVSYIIAGSAVAPIANLYLDRAGMFWVCAAGATNTNGAGRDSWGGGVPDNRMNEYAIGIEIANDGVGEPYTQAQQDAVVAACVALCAAYDISPHEVRAHFEWAPARKIDPTGPSRWSPYGGKWAMSAFRADITAPIPPPSTDTEVDMIQLSFPQSGQPTTEMVYTGTELAWLENGHAAVVLDSAKVTKVSVTRDQVRGVILASHTTTRAPFTLDKTLADLWASRAL
jgi:N-acetylmuramoyl-L-alanine amidase